MTTSLPRRFTNTLRLALPWMLTVTILIGIPPAAANEIILEWAARMGGGDFDFGNGIAVDDLGNVYTTGSFGGTVDFDPGPGTVNLSSQGLQDAFISKLDSSGNFVWAKTIRGAGTVQATDIALDASGNAYITGRFDGVADFNPGAATFNLSSRGAFDIFICKLDTAGNFLWAKAIGSAMGSDSGAGIAIDASGNVYTAGTYAGTADFNPGTGNFNLGTDGSTDTQIFVSKLNSGGEFVWAKAMGGPLFDSALSIDVDDSGNVVTTGYFQGPGDFDPGPETLTLTGSAGFDIFVSKLNSSGDFMWAGALAGSSNNNQGLGIALDPSGNVYTTGQFQGMVDFNPGPGTFLLESGVEEDAINIFVSKLASDGSFVWAKKLTGSSFSDLGFDIIVDAFNTIIITGRFSGTVDFDPGPETFALTSEGGNNTFVCKINSAGKFLTAVDMGNPGGSEGRSIASDDSGNIYITGGLRETGDFDPGPGTLNLASAGDDDIFVVKLGLKFPHIVKAPPSPFIELGDKVTFMLSGTVEPPFEWSKNGVPLVNDPPRVTGADTSVLTIDPAIPGDSGHYRVSYDDGTKAPSQTLPFELVVVAMVPLLGIAGIALLATVCGIGGALRLRRRN